MKYVLITAVAILASISARAQQQVACTAYFQVLWTEPGAQALHLGMDSGQKRWWDGKGHKKYSGLCFNGAVASNQKPRYLVIWTKAKSFGPFTVNASNDAPAIPASEIFGQKPNALAATTPVEWIYEPRWDVASVTILFVSWDGGLESPPVYPAPGKLKSRVLWSDSARVLEASLKYLAQEPVPFPGK